VGVGQKSKCRTNVAFDVFGLCALSKLKGLAMYAEIHFDRNIG